eukprot:g57644.t1
MVLKIHRTSYLVQVSRLFRLSARLVPTRATRDLILPSPNTRHSFGSLFSAFARCQTSAHKGSQQPQRSLVWLRVFGKPLALDRIPLCSRVVLHSAP